MDTRDLGKRISSADKLNPLKLYIPFMFLNDQFGYSLKSIYRRLNNESDVDLGVYPDRFPNNIAQYFWIDEGQSTVKPWRALGELHSGLYFYYTAFCNGADNNMKNAGHMNVWMVSRYSDLVQFTMDNEAYAQYIVDTTPLETTEATEATETTAAV